MDPKYTRGWRYNVLVALFVFVIVTYLGALHTKYGVPWYWLFPASVAFGALASFLAPLILRTIDLLKERRRARKAQ